MKLKSTLILGSCFLILVSCGKKAEDYQNLIDEYKDIICISQDSTASLSAKTSALSRQLELQKEYTDALSDLDNEEKTKFMMKWSVAIAEASEGKCK